MTENSHNYKGNQTLDPLTKALTVFESSPITKLKSKQGFFIPIDNLGVLRISGPDSLEFLNAQLTVDISTLEKGKPLIAGYCNPKGRLLSIILITRLHDEYIIVTDSTILLNLEKKLNIYILRLKVTLQIDNSLKIFGLIGPQTSDLIEKIKKKLEYNNSDFSTIMPEFEHTGWENHLGTLFVMSSSNLSSLHSIIDEFTFKETTKLWNLFEIRSGTPRVTVTTSEMFIPQSLNLDLLGGINFQKGCYPGQEIVARVRYLGKIKQRMGRALVLDHPTPPIGTSLFLDPSGKKRAGKVVNSVEFSTKTGGELLVTIPTGMETQSKLYWDGSKEGITLTHTYKTYET